MIDCKTNPTRALGWLESLVAKTAAAIREALSPFLPVMLVGLAAMQTSCIGLSGTDQSVEGQRPLALNHVYIVLDEPTYEAIRESTELPRILGRSDGGLPDYAPPSRDADRIFFRGRETYLELFAPDNRFDEPVGKVGLALGYDDPVNFQRLEERWRTVCPDELRRTPIEFSRVDPPVPWFDALQCDSTAAGPKLAIWSMVYRQEFYRWQNANDRDQRPRTARADVLAPREADGQGRFDIVGLTLDVSANLFPTLVAQFQAAGFARDDGSGVSRFSGDGIAITLRQVDGPSQLMAVDFDISGLERELELGSAQLIPDARSGGRLVFQRR